MIWVPVIVMNVLLLVVLTGLAIADRLLASYGECRLTVTHEGDSRGITVQGGDYLRATLVAQGIDIPSSCGGKAACGYCKVKVIRGGGQMLPTEEAFMSRQDVREGMRLACQVKVTEDIEIRVPDFLTTVRNMVKNGTLNSGLRWDLKMKGAASELRDDSSLGVSLSVDDETTVNAIIEEYGGEPGSMMPVLQQVNGRLGYLPEASMQLISKATDTPLSSIYRLASFYDSLNLSPGGRHVITVCAGTACHVKGSEGILRILEQELGIARNSTTDDGLFTLRTVRCLGCCGLAPVVKVGDEIHGHMDRQKAVDLVARHRSESMQVSP